MFEQMEKAHHNLKELLLKNQEKHRAEMARMMETMIRISKGKDVASNPNLIEAAAGTGTSREEPNIHLALPHDMHMCCQK